MSQEKHQLIVFEKIDQLRARLLLGLVCNKKHFKLQTNQRN